MLEADDVQAWARLRGIATAYFQSRVLHEACERSVFTEIEQAPGRVEDLAVRLSLDEQATRMLLEALAALELLAVEEGVYRNTPAASRFLVEDSPWDQTEIVRLYRTGIESWERLGEALHCGHSPPEDADFEPRFVHAMHSTASVLAPLVVRAVGTEGVERVLDVGGGPGTYSIHFALASPTLRAEVLDIDHVVPIAREYAQIHEVADRVTARVGDYLDSDLGRDWDLVLLSNILHSNDREAARGLLKRVHAALRPGGRVALNEFVRDGRGDGPLGPALFALYMLVQSDGGDTYTRDELRRWLGEAGFSEVEFKPLAGTTNTVVLARKSVTRV